MTRIARCLAALLSLGSAHCLFAPGIQDQGYASCVDDKACKPGWHCQVGYCAPPGWWNEQYTARYQVLVRNTGDSAVPAAALGELLVGPQGALTVEQTGFGPALILAAPGGEQTRAVAMRDPRGEAYAFVFRFPADIAPGTTLGSLWLYVGGDSSLAPVYSDPAEVFSFLEPFTATELSTENFRVDGTVDLNGNQALLRPGAWLVTQTTFEGSVVRVDAQLAGAECLDWGIGLSAGAQPQSLTPPYALFTSTGTTEVKHEVQAGSMSPVEEVGDAFFSDGSPHRYGVMLLGDRVRFSVDDVVTADATLQASVGVPLYVHLYSRDCTLRVETLEASPAVLTPPSVSLSERIVWYP
ncbi:MAG: hypothetical protein ABIJ09_09675 [Pseudomonadota bacterium]